LRETSDAVAPLCCDLGARREVREGAVETRVQPARCQLDGGREREAPLSKPRVGEHEDRRLDHKPGRDEQVEVERARPPTLLPGAVAPLRLEPLAKIQERERVR
jgi:hypothetical protein